MSSARRRMCLVIDNRRVVILSLNEVLFGPGGRVQRKFFKSLRDLFKNDVMQLVSSLTTVILRQNFEGVLPQVVIARFT